MIIMNKQTLRVAKMTLSALVAVMTVAGSRPLTAQTTAPTSSQSDEQVLRDLVRQENEGKDVIKFTEDSVFVSGAYPRPLIGRAAQEQAHSSKSMANRSVKERRNSRHTTEVVRLAVSQSGDMAEEFGNFTLSFDNPDKTHTSFNGSYLRVWRKTDGEWKVDAFFARPNES
jgi:ketosteroid isomerase-like protein